MSKYQFTIVFHDDIELTHEQMNGLEAAFADIVSLVSGPSPFVSQLLNVDKKENEDD